MIKIIPALSVSNGKTIRLTQGNYSNPTVYDKSPLEVAKMFEDHGFKYVHFIDLDGARAGEVINYRELQMINAHTNLETDYSGGVRTDGGVQLAFEAGAKMITSSSVAATNQDLFTQWLISYGRNRLILAADFMGRNIATTGWQRKTQIDVLDHIQFYYDRSILYIKCTDIARDGVMEGPNFAIYKEILDRFPGVRLLSSGGVRSIADIEKLQEMGCYGVIIGKALYEGKVKLEDLESFIVSQA
jgi:phosphoribosylformimino-5-aminoimidazole carboxamide ribotide isomerase